MKYFLFPILVFAILTAAYPAAAADFSVNITQPETIYAGNTTNFSVLVTNGGINDWFSIAAIGTYSSWIAIGDQSIYVPYGSSASSALRLEPVSDAMPNNYEYSIIVSRASDKDNKIEKSVFANVLQSSSVIIKDSSLSCTDCKPGDMVTVSVSIRNIGSKQLNNMKIVFTLGDKTKTMSASSIDSGIVKAFSTDFSIDNVAAPGQYNIEAKVMQDTSVLAKKSMSFNIPSIPIVKTVKNISSSIFGNYITLVSTNYGNAAQTSEIKSNVLNAWYSVYSGTKPSSTGDAYSWAVSIAPSESVTIIYSEIFWPVPFAAVILVFIGAYYYMVLSSLSIRKKIIRHTGEISVSLDVRSGLRPIDNAVVRDIIPKEFELLNKFESIKPVIRKIHSGTEVVWRLGRLKSREERILHYRIKAVSDFRAVRLHPAELNGKRGDKIVSRISNYVLLHGETKELAKRIRVVVGK